MPFTAGRSWALGYDAATVFRTRSSSARAPRVPGVQTLPIPDAQLIDGSKLRSSRGSDEGQTPGEGILFGAASGAAGAGAVRHLFKKGVKTWYGAPDLVSIVQGSNSRLALKLCAVRPCLRRRDLRSRSRLTTAGS